MCKKSVCACFILCIATILLLALSACGGPETTSTTGSSGDTEATGGDTTSTSAPSEATETTTAFWQPNFDEPWNFDPIFTRGKVDLNDYDMEFTIDQTVYTEVPDIITGKIINKTGKGIWMCITTYIEKIQTVVENPLSSDADQPYAHIWVRLPYYMWPGWGESGSSEMSWSIDLTKDSRYWREPYEFTPGKYRITLFFPDGPHYAYFEITG